MQPLVLNYTTMNLSIEALTKAKERVEQTLKECNTDTKVEVLNGKLLLILSNGRNLELSNDEVKHQAMEHFIESRLK
jgi:serine/threonine protein kinase HipA of HipAB toxin-antitoxin module